MKTSAQRGFTLIELLVAISIIAILSVVGFVSFQNVRAKALDAKRRADIDSIKKAYETNYDPSASGGQGGYKPLTGSNFASGKIPTPDGTTSTSYIVAGPVVLSADAIYNNKVADGSGPNFIACTPIGSNTSSTCATTVPNMCQCATSTGGTAISTNTINTGSTCDAYGILNNGLVGWWKFDETTGLTAADSSGNSNTGNWDGTGTSHYTAGKFGNSGGFNGIDDIIVVADNPAFNLRITAYSVSAWIKPEVIDGYWAGIVVKPDGSFSMWFGAANTSSGYINHLFDDRADENTDCPDSSSVTINGITWTYITITNDGTTCKTYLNGVLDKQGSVTGPLVVDSIDLQIGGNYFKGNIDDVRIYNRALSAGEVSLLYNGGQGCF